MKLFPLSLLAITVSVCGVNAASISFSNFDTNDLDPLNAVVDSSGNAVTSSGVAALGYFTNEAAVSGGDFSSFVEYGRTSFASTGAFDTDGVFNDPTLTASIGSGSSFIGESLTAYIFFNGEALVAKHNTLTFEQDSPLFQSTFVLGENTTYLFGGSAGPQIDVGAGLRPSVSLAAVPEPSAYAALSGLLALSWVMLRRRRV